MINKIITFYSGETQVQTVTAQSDENGVFPVTTEAAAEAEIKSIIAQHPDDAVSYTVLYKKA